MIRPWYRSRLFWLGIPGLVFLLWLWLGGQSFYFGYIGITGPAETTARWIGAGDGSIYQATDKKRSGSSWPLGFYWREFHETPHEPITYFPRRPLGIRRTSSSSDSESREIRVAWWAAISGYTAVWLGAVVGWQRRKARLSRRAAAEMPGS